MFCRGLARVADDWLPILAVVTALGDTRVIRDGRHEANQRRGVTKSPNYLYPGTQQQHGSHDGLVAETIVHHMEQRRDRIVISGSSRWGRPRNY
jgi:hypothetical protein